jgi:hypothetical protein
MKDWWATCVPLLRASLRTLLLGCAASMPPTTLAKVSGYGPPASGCPFRIGPALGGSRGSC